MSYKKLALSTESGSLRVQQIESTITFFFNDRHRQPKFSQIRKIEKNF